MRVITRMVAALCMLIAGLLLGAMSASGAGCAVMTLQVSADGSLALSPQVLTVNAGTCVQFNNQTLFAARFTVGSYDETVPALSQSARSYSARPAGTRQTVTAREAAGTASGTIVIRASRPRPKPTPTPARSTRSPAPAHHPTPAASPATQTATPTAPAHSGRPSPRATAPASAPAASDTPFLSGRPSASASSPAATVVSGPLQPPTDRGTGLPAAIAALAAVATGGAMLRVLLAEPVAVDDGRSVGAQP